MLFKLFGRFSGCMVKSTWSHTVRSCHLQDRKVAILLYGFPPGVGATGTAALLNVPRSLEKTLAALRQQGYDVGTGGAIDGEAIVAALQAQVMTGCEPASGLHLSCSCRHWLCTLAPCVSAWHRSSRGWCHRAPRASVSWGLAMLRRPVLKQWVRPSRPSSSSRC